MALDIFPPCVTAHKMYDQLYTGPTTNILNSYIKVTSLERGEKCPVERSPWAALVSLAEGRVTWIYHPNKISHMAERHSQSEMTCGHPRRPGCPQNSKFYLQDARVCRETWGLGQKDQDSMRLKVDHHGRGHSHSRRFLYSVN